MTTRTLAIVSAGLSQPSTTTLLAERLADASAEALQRLGIETRLESIELRDHAHDLTNNLLTFFASQELQEVKDTVAGADAVIAATPIFSASYTGLFKTFFDLLDEDVLVGTPVLIAATSGTARHSLALDHALRPLFTYLKAVVVPTGVFAASEDWGASGEIGGSLSARIDRAGAELAALVAAAPPKAVTDPFEDPVPFDQLMGDGSV